jgi:hypothetical protein
VVQQGILVRMMPEEDFGEMTEEDSKKKQSKGVQQPTIITN